MAAVSFFYYVALMFPFQNNPQNVNNMLDDSEEGLDYEPYSDSIVNEEEGDESEDNLWLRKYMVRFQEKQAEVEKWTDNLTLYVRNRIKEVSEDAKYLQVWYGRGDYHETVDWRRKTNIVHLGHRTCDCELWQMAECRRLPHIPPDIKSRVGKPKKSRRREVDECRPRNVRCTNCKHYGHNRSTCTNPRNPSTGFEKRRNRQPRRRIKVRSETGAGVVQGSQGGTFVHSNLTDIGSQNGSTSQM
ncbi:hypothetical protein Dsin_022258 [Dipteronia sinensis]|uniref:Uncharacterized protein n=1 Tax=Dipteronia sinensis TaxID=43782 RepID=A0AAE0A1F1_9ROSI|nr:hypothetical protein Dsin_022258 [Dipteronia sinensis]